MSGRFLAQEIRGLMQSDDCFCAIMLQVHLQYLRALSHQHQHMLTVNSEAASVKSVECPG